MRFAHYPCPKSGTWGTRFGVSFEIRLRALRDPTLRDEAAKNGERVLLLLVSVEMDDVGDELQTGGFAGGVFSEDDGRRRIAQKVARLGLW